MPASRVHPSVVRLPNNRRVQEKVILAETVGLNRSNADYYALELGNHVLGGGFYATRLYRELREKAGLVYYVGSNFQIDKTRGFYIVNYACDPVNVAKAHTIVRQSLEALWTTPVTSEELKQVKAMLLREIPLSEASTGSIANALLYRDALGLPLAEPTLAARRYLALTAEAVRSAFAKWIRPDDLVQITAELPYAAIGSFPTVTNLVDQFHQKLPVIVVRGTLSAVPVPGQIKQFTEGIQLNLTLGGIADPYRFCPAIAR